MKKLFWLLLFIYLIPAKASWDVNMRIVPLASSNLEKSSKQYAALFMRAYNILANCNYLENKHNAKYELLLRPRKIGVFVTEYEELFANAIGVEVEDNQFCGYAFPKEELGKDADILDNVLIIYAHEAEKKGDCSNTTGYTMAHEILHAIGFLHDTKVEKIEYDNILAQCIDEQALRDENK